MKSKQYAYFVAGVVMVVMLQASPAQAGKVRFGTQETINTIQMTNNPQYNLGYKTSTYFFLAGCYLKDDGYVLQKVGNTQSYISLNTAQIHELQQEGTLPTPLPTYSISFLDYFFGYSNWIILGVTIVWTWIQSHSKPDKAPPTDEKPSD